MTLEDLAELHGLCFPDAPWSEDTLSQLMDQPMVQLITVDGGFLIASIIPPEAEILTLCVHPDLRRTGKAGRLLNLLFQDVDRVFLEVAAGNAAARALYAAYGFAQTGHRAEYYKRNDGTRADAVTLACALT